MRNSPMVFLALADLPEESMRTCAIEGREIVVCRTKGGNFALDKICTHAFARLSEGRLRKMRLICPLHGASFDVRDGRALGSPAIRGLATHHAELTGEQVEIALNARESVQ